MSCRVIIGQTKNHLFMQLIYKFIKRFKLSNLNYLPNICVINDLFLIKY